MGICIWIFPSLWTLSVWNQTLLINGPSFFLGHVFAASKDTVLVQFFNTLSLSRQPPCYWPLFLPAQIRFCVASAAGPSFLHLHFYLPAAPGGLRSKSQVQKQASGREEVHLGKRPWGLTLDSSMIAAMCSGIRQPKEALPSRGGRLQLAC